MPETSGVTPSPVRGYFQISEPEGQDVVAPLDDPVGPNRNVIAGDLFDERFRGHLEGSDAVSLIRALRTTLIEMSPFSPVEGISFSVNGPYFLFDLHAGGRTYPCTISPGSSARAEVDKDQEDTIGQRKERNGDQRPTVGAERQGSLVDEQEPGSILETFADASSKEEICAMLVAARKQAGLSQEALAERMGVSRPNVIRLEKGRSSPNWTTLQRYADAAGMKVEMRLVPK